MAVYTEIWFWFIIVAIILLVVALILWFTIQNEDYRWWIWVFLIGGFALLIIGIIWGAVSWKSPSVASALEDTKHVVHHHDEAVPMVQHVDPSGQPLTPHEIHSTEHIGTVYAPKGDDVEVHHESGATVTPLYSPPSPVVALPVIR